MSHRLSFHLWTLRVTELSWYPRCCIPLECPTQAMATFGLGMWLHSSDNTHCQATVVLSSNSHTKLDSHVGRSNAHVHQWRPFDDALTPCNPSLFYTFPQYDQFIPDHLVLLSASHYPAPTSIFCLQSLSIESVGSLPLIALTS